MCSCRVLNCYICSHCKVNLKMSSSVLQVYISTRDHLDGTTLKGETLVCTFSRFDRVRMPYEANLPADDMTKDFSGEQFKKYRRFWNEDLKKTNMKKIMMPTKTIHISGIQAGKSPNDVKRAFQGAGLQVPHHVTA